MSILDVLVENEYLRFVIILIGTIILVTLSYFILKFIVNRIAGKKKNYGEFIFKQLSKPFILLLLIIGIYSAIRQLSIIIEYIFWFDGSFFVLTIFIIALLISRIISVIMIGYLKIKRGFERPPKLINMTASIVIYIIAIAVILAYFKIDVTPLIAGVGLGALAIGLALQSTLSNFFAGMHLVSDRPIDVGDYIEIDENTKGTIEDIGWRSTRIKTLADNLLIIPNGKLAESNITNFSKPKQDMSLWIPCGVAYESDLKKVEKVTLEVAKNIQQSTDGAVRDFEPAFRFKEFGDSNINFLAILRVNEPMKRFTVRNEFIKALKERFDKEGIEISWPIRKIYNIKNE
jgi:small-conductance mechanosensitive channel